MIIKWARKVCKATPSKACSLAWGGANVAKAAVDEIRRIDPDLRTNRATEKIEDEVFKDVGGGAATGAAAGATLGAVGGPVGVAVGAALGGAAGSVAGAVKLALGSTAEPVGLGTKRPKRTLVTEPSAKGLSLQDRPRPRLELEPTAMLALAAQPREPALKLDLQHIATRPSRPRPEGIEIEQPALVHRGPAEPAPEPGPDSNDDVLIDGFHVLSTRNALDGGTVGKYFVFPATSGYKHYGSRVAAKQYRDGEELWCGDVIVWDTLDNPPEPPPSCDAHGRRDPLSDAEEGQWEVGDLVHVPGYHIDRLAGLEEDLKILQQAVEDCITPEDKKKLVALFAGLAAPAAALTDEEAMQIAKQRAAELERVVEIFDRYTSIRAVAERMRPCKAAVAAVACQAKIIKWARKVCKATPSKACSLAWGGANVAKAAVDEIRRIDPDLRTNRATEKNRGRSFQECRWW